MIRHLLIVCFLLTACNDTDFSRSVGSKANSSGDSTKKGGSKPLPDETDESDQTGTNVTNTALGTIDSTIANTPGGILQSDGSYQVAKVSVGFEDYKDFDFNDANICLVGRFFVKDRVITSEKDQTVKVTTANLSQNHHYISVAIIAKDGTAVTQYLNGRGTAHPDIVIKAGSRVETKMLNSGQTTGSNGVPQTDEKNAVVERNVCRNTGI